MKCFQKVFFAIFCEFFLFNSLKKIENVFLPFSCWKVFRKILLLFSECFFSLNYLNFFLEVFWKWFSFYRKVSWKFSLSLEGYFRLLLEILTIFFNDFQFLFNFIDFCLPKLNFIDKNLTYFFEKYSLEIVFFVIDFCFIFFEITILISKIATLKKRKISLKIKLETFVKKIVHVLFDAKKAFF